MFKHLLISTALIMGPGAAMAATLTQLTNGAASIAAVDKATSVDLTGIGSWINSPLTVTDDDFKRRTFISPFFGEPDDKSIGFWAMGDSRKPDYVSTANSDTPARLELNNLTQSISFLWGSPDRDNAVTFLLGDTVVASFNGGDITATGSGAVFTTITADGVGEFFDTLLFSSSNPSGGGRTFEFSSLTTISAPPPAVVPLPAGLVLLLTAVSGLGFLARRKATV